MERCLACEAERGSQILRVVHFALQFHHTSKEHTIRESSAPISVATPFGLASEATLHNSRAETLFAFSSAIGYRLLAQCSPIFSHENPTALLFARLRSRSRVFRRSKASLLGTN